MPLTGIDWLRGQPRLILRGQRVPRPRTACTAQLGRRRAAREASGAGMARAWVVRWCGEPHRSGIGRRTAARRQPDGGRRGEGRMGAGVGVWRASPAERRRRGEDGGRRSSPSPPRSLRGVEPRRARAGPLLLRYAAVGGGRRCGEQGRPAERATTVEGLSSAAPSPPCADEGSSSGRPAPWLSSPQHRWPPMERRRESTGGCGGAGAPDGGPCV